MSDDSELFKKYDEKQRGYLKPKELSKYFRNELHADVPPKDIKVVLVLLLILNVL